MAADADLPAVERLVRLLNHLGIARTHIAGGAHQAIALADTHPEVVASLTLVRVGPGIVRQLRPASRQALAPRILFVHGDTGAFADALPRVLQAFPGASTAALREYPDILWADLIADRRDEVAAALLPFIEGVSARDGIGAAGLPEQEGEVAGITFQVRGSGPPLVLVPIGLAPSQWDPLIPVLAEHYCTVVLGGAFLGVASALEQRARTGYVALVDGLVGTVAPRPGETILEVGCGSGAIVRRLARRTGEANPIVGVDLSPYLVGLAGALARAEGLADRITFREGNAEALPFPPDSVDVAISCTVMEEVDADRMLAELVRVVKPGGRVGVIVRANDMPRWINLPLRPELTVKAAAVPMAGVSDRGCADAGLYRRFRAAGLVDLTMGPQLAANQPAAGLEEWRAGFELQVAITLDATEADEWREGIAQADAEGTYLWADPYHCAVGTKP